MTNKSYVPGAAYKQFMPRTVLSVLIYFSRLWLEYDLIESNDLQFWTPLKTYKRLAFWVFPWMFQLSSFFCFQERNATWLNQTNPGFVFSDEKMYRNVYLLWFTRPFFRVPCNYQPPCYKEWSTLNVSYILFRCRQWWKWQDQDNWTLYCYGFFLEISEEITPVRIDMSGDSH